MSLTSEIRTPGSETRLFVDQHFPNIDGLARELNVQLKRYAFVSDNSYESAAMYAISGRAIDYRIRAYFTPNFFNNAVIEGGFNNLQTTGLSGPNPFLTSWFAAEAPRQITLAASILRSIRSELEKKLRKNHTQ